MTRPRLRRLLLLAAAPAALSLSCNAALGGGLVAVLGAAGYAATQCYDRVRVRVRVPETGLYTCEADVILTDSEGSERELRPCYSAALTEGKWRLAARHPGYEAATTEVEIPERDGACPHYTHSIELTLRRPGAPSSEGFVSPRRGSPAPSSPTPAASELESPPARTVPPPIPLPAPVPAPVAPPEPAPAQPAPAPAPPEPAQPAPAPAPPAPDAPPPASPPPPASR